MVSVRRPARGAFLFWYTLLFLSVANASRGSQSDFDYHKYLDAVTSRARSVIDHASEIIINPLEEDHEVKEFKDLVIPSAKAIGMTVYGLSLLLYSKDFRGQIHLITMLRSTGFDKISNAVQELRRNIRHAVFSFVWHSPSFAMATKSITMLDDRVRDAKRILAETRQAKADGVVTRKEASHLKRMKRREIKAFQRDMRRLVRAGASLKKVWKALDLDEICDLTRGFMFQLLAVMASSGDEDAPGVRQKIVGRLLSRWCIFLNLGTLLLDTNSKLGYPIARFIHRKSLPVSKKAVDEEYLVKIEKTAEFVMFSSAGYLVLLHNKLSRHLNAAFVSSAVTFRGLRSFVKTICWEEVDADDHIFVRAVARLGDLIEGTSGGILMLALSSVGLVCRYRAEIGKDAIQLPALLLAPINATEVVVENAAEKLDEIF